jgi:hypothetical protein
MSAEPAIFNFDEITEAGTYIETRWGTLFRMPAGIFPLKRRHAAECVKRDRWPVIRLSPDPRISLAAAHKLAAALGVWVTFAPAGPA